MLSIALTLIWQPFKQSDPLLANMVMESYITSHWGLELSNDRNGSSVSCTTCAMAYSHEPACASASNQDCCFPKTEIALQDKVILAGWKSQAYLPHSADSVGTTGMLCVVLSCSTFMFQHIFLLEQVSFWLIMCFSLHIYFTTKACHVTSTF